MGIGPMISRIVVCSSTTSPLASRGGGLDSRATPAGTSICLAQTGQPIIGLVRRASTISPVRLSLIASGLPSSSLGLSPSGMICPLGQRFTG